MPIARAESVVKLIAKSMEGVRVPALSAKRLSSLGVGGGSWRDSSAGSNLFHHLASMSGNAVVNREYLSTFGTRSEKLSEVNVEIKILHSHFLEFCKSSEKGSEAANWVLGTYQYCPARDDFRGVRSYSSCCLSAHCGDADGSRPECAAPCATRDNGL